jgi:hypothetical protein
VTGRHSRQKGPFVIRNLEREDSNSGLALQVQKRVLLLFGILENRVILI